MVQPGFKDFPQAQNIVFQEPEQPLISVQVHGKEIMIGNFTLTNVLGLVLLSLISGIVTGMMTMGGGIIQVSGMMMIFGYGLILVRPVVYITNIFVFAASAYRSKAKGFITWKAVADIIPWVVSGVIFGYILGNQLGDQHVGYLIGFIALGLGIKTILELMGVKEIKFETDNTDEVKSGLSSDKVNSEKTDSDDDLYQLLDDETPDQLTEKAKKLGTNNHVDIWFKKLKSKSARSALVGIPVGFISGVLGIPGGILGVPLQQHLHGSSLHRAIANSAILGFFASLTGVVIALTHGINTGLITWSTILSLSAIMVPGAYIGGMIGARLLHAISINLLRWVYLVIMLIVASRIFLV